MRLRIACHCGASSLMPPAWPRLHVRAWIAWRPVFVLRSSLCASPASRPWSSWRRLKKLWRVLLPLQSWRPGQAWLPWPYWRSWFWCSCSRSFSGSSSASSSSLFIRPPLRCRSGRRTQTDRAPNPRHRPGRLRSPAPTPGCAVECCPTCRTAFSPCGSLSFVEQATCHRLLDEWPRRGKEPRKKSGTAGA